MVFYLLQDPVFCCLQRFTTPSAITILCFDLLSHNFSFVVGSLNSVCPLWLEDSSITWLCRCSPTDSVSVSFGLLHISFLLCLTSMIQ